LYYNEAVKINYDKFDHTNAGGTYYSTRLTGGSTGEKYGLTKTLSVMPGDKISMEVYAKYLDPDNNNWNTALTNFIGSITGGTAPAGTLSMADHLEVLAGGPIRSRASITRAKPVQHRKHISTTLSLIKT
jgi:hypothetical protein